MTLTDDVLQHFIQRSLGEYLFIESEYQTLIEAVKRVYGDYHASLEAFPTLRYIDDVDSSFLQYITKEVGLALPSFADEASTRQFLKEAKAWYSGKGSAFLYSYIGALTKTSIYLWEPSKLIARTDYPPTLVDGMVNKPPAIFSKLNHIRDGIFWSFYTYVLEVSGAQNLRHWTDVTNLVDLVHPAGTKYFFDLFYEWEVLYQAPGLYPCIVIEKDSFVVDTVCLLDAQITTDGPCLTDGHTTLYWFVEEFQGGKYPYCFGGRFLGVSELMNDYLPGTPLMTWRVDKVDYSQSTGYQQHIGPHDDANSINHLSIVASASEYTYEAIRDLSYEGAKLMHYKTNIENWAVGGLMYMPYLPMVHVIRYQDFEDYSNPGTFYTVSFGAEIEVTAGAVSGASGWTLNGGYNLIVDNGTVTITTDTITGAEAPLLGVHVSVVSGQLVYSLV